ncbi:MAG: insulinase family protein [Clostridia bacterium]|nr:insulinase family protein [Clostridia bacterium]
MKKQLFESPFGAEYTKCVLDNGLTLYVMEKPQFSSSYAMFGTKYGSIDMNFSDREGNRVDIPAGTAHFLEHKLFESEDGDAFSKFSVTGASANAFTSFDRTCYLFSCGDNFYDNYEILLSFVQSPYFTTETINKEQGIIGQEIRMYDDSPGWRVLFNMLHAMYYSHPVKNDIAGTTESIAQITADTLYKCYNAFYNPSNMFVCVCGNVDTNRVIEMTKDLIKAETGYKVERFMPVEAEGVKEHLVEEKMSVMLPIFTFGFKQKCDERLKLKSKVCINLLLETLAGDSSPLYARLTKAGLIGESFDFELMSYEGAACIIFEGESEKPEEVRKEILREIENIRENGIDKRLFSAVKCRFFGEEIRKLDSVEEMCMQFAESNIAGYELFDKISAIKSVSADEVFRYIDLLREENSVLSVIKPLEE